MLCKSRLRIDSRLVVLFFKDLSGLTLCIFSAFLVFFVSPETIVGADKETHHDDPESFHNRVEWVVEESG